MADGAATLITIYSLTGGSEKTKRGLYTGQSDYDVAERIFGPDVRLKSAPTDLREWRPKPFGDYEWHPTDYSTGKEMPYTVSGVRTYFVNCLFAGNVLVLELRLRGSLTNYIDAQRNAFDRMVRKQLAGQDLFEAAASHVNGIERDLLHGLTFGQDKHQIMVLSRADAGLIFSTVDNGKPSRQSSARGAVQEADEPLDLDQVDLAALGRLMFKDVQINYRPARTPISWPDDINGPDLQMVAVWATNTVVCGIEAYNNLGPDYGDLGARRIRELTYVAAQIVAAANRCREIRVATLSVLGDLDRDRSASSHQAPNRERAELISIEGELHRLEFDLTWGADVYRGPALVRGGRPLERYQAAVRAEGGFDANVALTNRMVGYLANIVTKKRQIFEMKHQGDQLEALNKLLDRTEGVKTASIVVATIVVVVSCVGLFATLATVPMSSSGLFLGPQFRSAAAAALSVIFAGALGFVIHRASIAPELRNNRAKLVGRVAWGLAFVSLAGLALALWLWSHSGITMHWIALACGVAVGLIAVYLGARSIDFGDRRKRPGDKTAHRIQ